VVADADFDDDGDVDGNDLLAWQRGLGPGATHAEGDANGDGVANAVDLAVWRYQAGWTEAVVVAGAAVPEPAGVLLALSFLVLVKQCVVSSPKLEQTRRTQAIAPRIDPGNRSLV
jgi:hypothetical protein